MKLARLFQVAEAIVLLALVACSPAPQGAPDAQAGAPRRETPKVLTVAIQREPESLGTFVGSIGSGSPTTDVAFMIHNYLVVENDRGFNAPQLAVELPSVEKGTWRVNTDGSMDTTWRVHPNVIWHDGAPFTVEDLLFSLRTHQDPDLPRPIAGPVKLITSAIARDAYTIEIHWASTFIEADSAIGMAPIPAHLLQSVYAADKQAFVNHPLFTTEFVGLGPYRLDRWEQGSQMELVRFDAYYGGRPAFDRVVVRFVADPNTQVASILAGAVDVVLAGGVDIDAAAEVRRRWEGTGNRVQANMIADLEHVELQHRDEFARPRNGLTIRAVRQALVHVIDRPSLTEVSTLGLAPAADSWIRPDDPNRAALDSAIPKLSYDPARALDLLASAGWRRGADGMLIQERTGDRFEIEIRARDAGSERDTAIVADSWKKLGMDVSMLVVPAARRSDREYESMRPGALVSNPRASSLYRDRLHSGTLATAANRWAGTNKSGYVNPQADQLFDQLSSAIDPREQVRLQRLALEEVIGDVAIIPLFWEVEPVLALASVRAALSGAKPTWDFARWDKD